MHDDTPAPCSEARPLTRPRYFAGQLLTADDLADEQAYLLDKLRAHNRLLHGYGTVCGLAVEPTEPPSGSVVVRPGVALDCCGRELVLAEPVEVDLHDLGEGAHDVSVTMRHGEAEVAQVPVPTIPTEPADDAVQASRISETPRIEIIAGSLETPSAPSPTDSVHPCPPCPDERILLATIRLPRSGVIGPAEIDLSTRPVVEQRCATSHGPTRSQTTRARCGWLVALGIGLLGWWLNRRRR